MAGSSYSTQQSSGSGYSNSNPIQTPQSEWGLQLSQLLTALGQNQYQWAMQQFNNGMGITNQNINQYMDLAGKGAGLAQNLLSRYTDVFEPLMDQFIQQAGSYASEGRQRFMAGQAESTVAQANQQARDEAERKLQGFGINPNSGRYQDLLLTSRIQDAAARAGAGTQASLNTADRGRAMLQSAAQMGQNVPGMTVNALNSAYTGITGAENAILGMLNTGANLANTVPPYYNAADNAIKMPSQGTQSKNQQQSTGRSVSMQSNPPQQDRQQQPRQQQPSNGNRNDGNGPANANGYPGPLKPSYMQNPFAQQPGAGIIKPDAGTGQTDDKDNGYTPYPTVGSPETGPYFDQNGVISPMGDPNFARDANGDLQTPDTAQWDGPQAPNWSPDNMPDFQPQGAGTPNDFNYDPNQMQSGGWDPSSIWSPQPQNPDNPWGDSPQQSQSDQGGSDYWNNFANQWGNDNQFDTSQYDQGDTQQQQSPDYGGGDYWQQQSNAGGEYQQQSPDYGSYGGYAKGGRVRPRSGQRKGVIPTTGGNVSRNMSPSRGRQTDDVPARLNAGEFVVPRDVVAHKGSEFFQNLIKKSRASRTGMSGPPARGKMKPSLPNMSRPSFVSRRMGA